MNGCDRITRALSKFLNKNKKNLNSKLEAFHYYSPPQNASKSFPLKIFFWGIFGGGEGISEPIYKEINNFLLLIKKKSI